MAIVAKRKKTGGESGHRSSAMMHFPTRSAWVLGVLLCVIVTAWVMGMRGGAHKSLNKDDEGALVMPRISRPKVNSHEGPPRNDNSFPQEGDMESSPHEITPVRQDANDATHSKVNPPLSLPASPEERGEMLQKPRKQGRIFKSSTEQVISGFANTRPGYPPPPIIRFPMGEDAMSILERPIEIEEDDDEKTIEIKENCARLKEEIRQFIAEGGTAENFLVQYHNELSKDYEDWKASQQYVVQLLREGDLEEARRYAEEANAELTARGVRNVKLPENLVRQLEDGK